VKSGGPRHYAVTFDLGDLDDSLYQRGVERLGYDGLIELTWIVGV